MVYPDFFKHFNSFLTDFDVIRDSYYIHCVPDRVEIYQKSSSLKEWHLEWSICSLLSVLLPFIRPINVSKFTSALNPHTPVAQNVADEVVFRRFQGEGVGFFKIGPPPLRFLMRIFWKILIEALPAFIRKVHIFCRISDESALIRILRRARVKSVHLNQLQKRRWAAHSEQKNHARFQQIGLKTWNLCLGGAKNRLWEKSSLRVQTSFFIHLS